MADHPAMPAMQDVTMASKPIRGMLIGDETALPATIARLLEELPAGARAVVLAEVEAKLTNYPS